MSAWRFVNTFRQIVRSKLRYLFYHIKYGNATPPECQIFFINPDTISDVLCPSFFYQHSRRGTYVIGGEWDKRQSSSFVYNRIKEFDLQTRVPIKDYVYYKSLHKRFIENAPWENTDLFQWAISEDTSTSRYSTEEKVKQRFEEIDKLYDQIKNNGYKSSMELHGSPIDEIQVDIGRDGDIILDDGRHRLIIAKLLGIEQIPVRVSVRHTDWMKIRSEIVSNSESSSSEFNADILNHPDLQDLSRD